MHKSGFFIRGVGWAPCSDASLGLKATLARSTDPRHSPYMHPHETLALHLIPPSLANHQC